MEHKKKKRILVVDDHEDNIELLRARLEARGYEIHAASDGQAALDQVDRVLPDLILLDVMMPKMDGMEVVRRLKADKNLDYAKVLDALDIAMHNGVTVAGLIGDQKPGTVSTIPGDQRNPTPAPGAPPGGAK